MPSFPFQFWLLSTALGPEKRRSKKLSTLTPTTPSCCSNTYFSAIQAFSVINSSASPKPSQLAGQGSTIYWSKGKGGTLYLRVMGFPGTSSLLKGWSESLPTSSGGHREPLSHPHPQPLTPRIQGTQEAI